MACAASRRVIADLPVQSAQGLEDVVIQVTAKHEWQNGAAQDAGRTGIDGLTWRDHPTLQPRESLPFAPLHLEILFKGAQRHGGRPRVAVGSQRQIHPKHEAVLGGVADQSEDQTYRAGKILLVGDPAVAVRRSGCFAVFVVDVDQVDVARNIELARTELAHADNPQLCAFAEGGHRRPVAGIKFRERLATGHVQREFGQRGDAVGDDLQSLLCTVQDDQAVHDQLTQDAQRSTRRVSLSPQRCEGRGDARGSGGARGQEGKLRRITPLQSLKEARSGLGRGCRISRAAARVCGSLQSGSTRLGCSVGSGAGHNSCHIQVPNE